MTYPFFIFLLIKKSNKKTTFKSTFDILDELSDKWQDLTDIQQASITELVAGKWLTRIYSNIYKEHI